MRIYSLTKVICDCMSTTLCAFNAKNGVPSIDEACKHIEDVINTFCNEALIEGNARDRMKEDVREHLRDIIAVTNFNNK